ncbi:penicillin-binding protein 2 [Candidatus Symbiobacter mobilis]|uniref:Peptidoglycan D,D-transpeptidase MrdA n=1 Tax=Candidatus Symbiobacter mobilis CR TaxID=946483 RepID=U5N8A6_9BURK|nr:penicillin-binding protein 2 [Candidatus Symbiobacter mobilis]AGX86498.1 penicillin-binding protein 2 [Candidatus Symbiobacter mobilis CR]
MTVFRNIQQEIAQFRLRVLVAAVLVLLCFALVLGRLVFLQVIRHAELREQAESNRTAIVPIVPNRGLILDRNGLVLANNYSAYMLEITPSKVQDLDSTIDGLAKVLEVTPWDRRRFKKLCEEARNFGSIPLRSRLSDAEVARFAVERYRFPGVDIKARLFRHYPQGTLASHVVGYIGRINVEEQEKIEESEDPANYRGTQYIGKLGIEQSYEALLHGTTGIDAMETSAAGRAVRRLASQSAKPGDTVRLSIDITLQKLVEDLYGDRRGALVAIDPRNGEVLAFVSKPTFDPNLFVEGIDQDNWQLLNGSPDKPLLNRALRGTYPPGSTYKPFMALAALSTGARSASTVIHDPGYYVFGGHRFGSPENERGGMMNMHRAIVESSNAYFYSLANEMGVDAIHDFMQSLGLGQITGIDLPGEVRGILPSQAWKRSYYRRAPLQKWYAGETISLGIGQGYNSFTMLQLALATATIANHGLRNTPRLVLSVQDTSTDAEVPLTKQPPVNLGLRREHLEVVRNAMVGVTTEGTSARVFAGAGYVSGGKTGTAQAVSLGKNERYNAARMAERQRDHSLYIAFAPAHAPTIALAAIVENAGFGAAAAAPIARRVFDYWLLHQLPNEEDMAAVRKGQALAPLQAPRMAIPDPSSPPSLPASATTVALQP